MPTIEGMDLFVQKSCWFVTKPHRLMHQPHCLMHNLYQPELGPMLGVILGPMLGAILGPMLGGPVQENQKTKND